LIGELGFEGFKGDFGFEGFRSGRPGSAGKLVFLPSTALTVMKTTAVMKIAAIA
jgi:hypothetical protein